MQEAGLNSFYHTSERGFLLFTLGSFALWNPLTMG
jgi:hypothetical protein